LLELQVFTDGIHGLSTHTHTHTHTQISNAISKHLQYTYIVFIKYIGQTINAWSNQ